MARIYLIIIAIAIAALSITGCVSNMPGPALGQLNSSGSISFVSEPSGATLYIDDVNRGTTPLVITNLSSGSHSIRLEKPGYPTYTSTRYIYSGQTTYSNVTLASTNQSQFGMLSVASNPAGASLYVDSILQGATPLTINSLTVGTHSVRLAKVSYNDYTGIAAINAGQTTNLNISLGQNITTGDLYVQTIPSNASLYVDSIMQGTTPLTINSLTVGTHQVRLAKVSYNDYTGIAAINAGQTTNLNISLGQNITTGDLYVQTIPGGASLYVDNQTKGPTPIIAHGLNIGSHDVILNKANYQIYRGTIDIYSGQTTNLSVTLPQLVGNLYVESIPGNASLYVDSQLKGLTPITVQNLTVGTPHSISLTKTNYGTYYTTRCIFANLTTYEYPTLQDIGVVKLNTSKLPSPLIQDVGLFIGKSGLDSNNNGRREVVLKMGSNIEVNNFGIYELQASNSFTQLSTIVLPQGMFNVFKVGDIGDADNDGSQEIVFYGYQINNYSLRFYRRQGNSSTWSSVLNMSILRSTIPPKIFDVDNDGKNELVVNWFSSPTTLGGLNIYKATGPNQYQLNATYQFPTSAPTGFQSYDVCSDLNGDGKNEIIVGGEPDVYILEYIDGAYTPIAHLLMYGSDGQPINIETVKCLGDTDGDGKGEFLAGGLKVAAPTGDTAYYNILRIFEPEYLNSTNFVQTEEFKAFETMIGDSFVAVGDIDRDGKNEFARLVTRGWSSDCINTNQSNYVDIFKSYGNDYHAIVFNTSYIKPMSLAIYPDLAMGDLGGTLRGELVMNEYTGSSVVTRVYAVN